MYLLKTAGRFPYPGKRIKKTCRADILPTANKKCRCVPRTTLREDRNCFSATLNGYNTPEASDGLQTQVSPNITIPAISNLSLIFSILKNSIYCKHICIFQFALNRISSSDKCDSLAKVHSDNLNTRTVVL